MRPWSSSPLQKGSPDTCGRGDGEGETRDTQVPCFPSAEKRGILPKVGSRELGWWWWVTGQERGMGKEALGIWLVGATHLLSDHPQYFPASLLSAARDLPVSPTTWGKIQDTIVGGGLLDNS